MIKPINSTGNDERGSESKHLSNQFHRDLYLSSLLFPNGRSVSSFQDFSTSLKSSRTLRPSIFDSPRNSKGGEISFGGRKVSRPKESVNNKSQWHEPA